MQVPLMYTACMRYRAFPWYDGFLQLVMGEQWVTKVREVGELCDVRERRPVRFNMKCT